MRSAHLEALGPRPEGGKACPAAFFKAKQGMEEPPLTGDYFIQLDHI